jgi:hypothetical protein
LATCDAADVQILGRRQAEIFLTMAAPREVPEYDALMEPGDFSPANGDLRLTKDGDLQIGDAVYSAMFRLVQTWRYSRPHLAQVFALTVETAQDLARLAERTEAITIETHGAFDQRSSAQDHFAPLREAFEASGAVELGRQLYAGCIILLLDGMLRRFQDDVAAGEAWRQADSKFNGVSFGRFVVASANSFRHADEWAKTRSPTKQAGTSSDWRGTS